MWYHFIPTDAKMTSQCKHAIKYTLYWIENIQSVGTVNSKYFTFLLQLLVRLITAHGHHITWGEWKVMPPTLLISKRWKYWCTTGWDTFYSICSFTSVGTQHVAHDSWKAISAFIRVKQSNKGYLTNWGRVTKICVFTLQLCKTDDANLRF